MCFIQAVFESSVCKFLILEMLKRIYYGIHLIQRLIFLFDLKIDVVSIDDHELIHPKLLFMNYAFRPSYLIFHTLGIK